MTKKLILTIGLPGSGKSFFANNFIKENPSYTKIERDDLRFELFGKYNIKPSQEEEVTKAQYSRVLAAISNEHNIIISDTNLNPKTQEKWKQFALNNNLELEIKDFRDIPLEQCAKQDLKREKCVGRDVILEMHQKYIRPTLYKHDNNKPNKPQAIIFDIDGTLATKSVARGIHDYDKVCLDSYNKDIFSLLLMFYRNNYEIIFLSGRQGKCFDDTAEWLAKYFPIESKNFKNNWVLKRLFLRIDGDMRKDYIVKKELFLQHVDQNYNVIYCVDDRDSVVRLWRDLGIRCLQVADGNF